MTLEEAINIMLNHESKDFHGLYHVDGALLNVVAIMNRLQKTYAPKIEMKKHESDMLEIIKRIPGTGVGIIDYQRPEPKVLLSNEGRFVEAWLHPELIEVVE